MAPEPAEDPGGLIEAPARPASTSSVRVLNVEDGARTRRADRLATEEPMEIRVDEPGGEQRTIAVTMRTPGHDFELAAGFLFTEGLIDPGDLHGVRYCDVPREEQHYNVVTAAVGRPLPDLAARAFYTTSSCGVCGKASLEALDVQCAPVAPGPEVAPEVLTALPEELRRVQRVFDRTGGLHAAALFDADGKLLSSREDVGRHNAVDKLVGAELMAGNLPLAGRILLVSGRASFEIVQKAAVAGIPIVCAVSAPSSLAVDAARRFGMTLVGFLREQRFNVYSHAERIAGGTI
jgi:FdhD protein